MNSYANAEELITLMDLPAATDKTALLRKLITASRMVDAQCNRFFYAENDAKVLRPLETEYLFIPDLLRLDSISEDGDGNGVAEVALTTADYFLRPSSGLPKVQVAFNYQVHSPILISGLWGYGNGKLASPFSSAGYTVTLSNDTTTSATVSSGTLCQTGQTVLVDSEQIFVQAISGTSTFTATVIRGCNGTTAAAHAAATAYKAEYPAMVTEATLSVASRLWSTRTKRGLISERMDDYSYTMAGSAVEGSYVLTKEEMGWLGPMIRRKY